MRKLLVGVLIAVLGLLAWAQADQSTLEASVNALESQVADLENSVSSLKSFNWWYYMKYAGFDLVVDEKGIDAHSYWKFYFGAKGSKNSGKVTATFKWNIGLNTSEIATPVALTDGGTSNALKSAGLSNSLVLDSLTFNGEKFYVFYKNDALYLDDKYFTGKCGWYGIGKDYVEMNLKSLPNLKVYYADLGPDETNPDSPKNKPDAVYFQDFAALNFSEDLGVFNMNAYAAYYYVGNTEYAAVAYMKGEKALKNFNLEGVFGKLANGNNVYGIDASYELSILNGNTLSLSVTPGLKYSENLENMAFSYSKKCWCGDKPPVSDGQYAYADVSIDMSFKPVSISLFTEPSYDFNSGLSAFTIASAGFSTDMFSANAKVITLDALKFNDWWKLIASASFKVSQISLSGKYAMLNTGKYAYNAKATFTLEEGLTLTAFYGTLYDANCCISGEEMYPDNPQWWLKLSYSM